MKRKFVILPLILACDLLVGCSVSSNESSNTSSGPEIATVVDIDDRIDYLSNDIPGEEELNLWWHANTISDDEWDEHYKEREDEDDYSWMLPQADHEIFTDQEKKQIEADTLLAATKVWELYENVTIDKSLTSLWT